MADHHTIYTYVRDLYAQYGVDTETAISLLGETPLSIHCWQGDDVTGFEGGGALTGGIAVTGNYPGKARNPQELMDDFSQVLSLVPGKKRLNLHASYAITRGESISRNQLTPDHFSDWMDYAKAQSVGLDFNPTFFSHPLSGDGMTLTHPDEGIRSYWIEHAKACRSIGAAMGKALGSPCTTNVWIPDGSKDDLVSRAEARLRLKDSLDQAFSQQYDKECLLDAVESKLFGIGLESFTAGSQEFYLAYAVARQILLTMDIGHFHPTETVSDKLSAVAPFVPGILLHLSRPVRWDSDHVIVLDNELLAVMRELVRGNLLSSTHIALDYFDASINRVVAWVIGARNAGKALLNALLEPVAQLRILESEGDFSARLALMEESKTLPWGIVWEEYCARQNIPGEREWPTEVRRYQEDVLSRRI